MPYPAPPLLWLLAAWSLLGLFASLQGTDRVGWWEISGMTLALLALLDALRLRLQAVPEARRDISGALPVGVWSEVGLILSNRHAASCALDVFDSHPQPAEVSHLPQQLSLPPQRQIRMVYRLAIQQRGEAVFDGVHLRLASPWRWWRRNAFIRAEDRVKVYPNFAAVAGYTLLATQNRLGEMGIRKQQRRGEGLEFHQLREYRAGDAMRQIDWNATSRQHKLISREYQDERDQQVVFLLDCGRRMRTQDGTLSHFDHVLNAMLLLAHVALREGDALGLLSFSGPNRWLAPRKGVNTLTRLLNSVYDLQPGTRPSDYLQAVEQFLLKQRRRALVILVSNLRDEDTDTLLPALRLLRGKHLVLFASLQEQALNQVIQAPFDDFPGALRHAATLTYLQQRREAHEALRRQGVLCLDCEPEQLPVALVNLYLDIKRSGRL